MKKAYIMPLVFLFCLVLILTSCTSVVGGSSVSIGKASMKPGTPVTEASNAPTAKETDSPIQILPTPVINPDQVLSAEEASGILGLPVSIEESTRNVDKENGISSLRYAYTLSEMTDVSALVQIEQDGLKPAEKLEEGLTARSSYDFQAELLKDEIVPVKDLGDEAFIMNNDGQLFMAYRGYYVVVAFTMDEYDSTKNAPFDIALGRKILENMKRLLNE